MNLTTPKLVGGVCVLILAVVTLQAAFPPKPPKAPPPGEPEEDCRGEPIVVDYPYTGWSEPHGCAVQCKDDNPRYILYTDGKATQCQDPPGCNDWGEDKGILCRPSLKSN